jgi:predicted metal-dependent hydrolase
VKVEVIRSAKRRRTVQARQIGDVLRISIPAAMTKSEEERWVGEMVRRMERKTASSLIDLETRSASLARKYGLGRPRSVRWVDNQQWRWGSCTPGDGTIRLSSRLASEPAWVIDYVLVHELAHLTVRHHNSDFWKLVHRYPLAERALGYLMARGLDADMHGASHPDGALVEDPRAGPGPGDGRDSGRSGPPRDGAERADRAVRQPGIDEGAAGPAGEVAAFRPARPQEPPPAWTGSLF